MLAGGKGTKLAELVAAGFVVPAGFIVTTEAYRLFIATYDLQERILAAVRAADPGDPTSVQRAAETIERYFEANEMPAAVTSALHHAYTALGGGPVAVRSSATSEDLPQASFAGQQATFLDVAGERPLQEAVRRCWASLWAARAISYRARQAIPHESVAMAVVIQRMVKPHAAGVLFTANPVTGDPDQMVVNSAPGLGEQVVTGEVTPEEVLVDRRTWTAQRHSFKQRLVLADAQAVELAQLGSQIEAHFGHPQDVEWAWADERFYVLQARPITSPVRPPLVWEPATAGDLYTRGGIMELMPDPISVLFETLGLPAIEQGLRDYQQRIGLGRAMQDWGFATINGYVYGRLRLGPGMVLGGLLSMPRLVRYAARAVDEWERETLPAYRQEVRSSADEPQGLPAVQLLRRMEALALACGRYWAVVATMITHLDRAERRFTLLYGKLRSAGDPEAAVFLRGLQNLPLQAEQALYAARTGDLSEVRARYGHVLYSLDFAMPLAGEDPSALRLMLRTWQDGGPGPAERRRRLAAEREQATQQVRERLPGWKLSLFDRTLAAAQRAARVREDALFELGLAGAPLRRYALELGRRLVKAGALLRPEQVFWVHHDDLTVAIDRLDRGEGPTPSLAETAEALRSQREAARGARVPFTVPERPVRGLMSLAVPTAEARRQTAGSVLTGVATSPGRVTAVARVLGGPEEFNRLGKGEILVARATTPAWTPLFVLASGLVTDLGGSLSHGSIVAREYGIPAVMGTGNATERIREGQTITLDGTAGRVTLHEA